MTAPTPTRLDMPQVLNRVFDEDNGLLRTSSQATVVNADINVNLDAAGGDNVAIHDEAGHELKVNTDGSLNVNVISTTNGITKNIFNEITGIVNGISTLLVTYTVPVGKKTVLEKIAVSGSNIAKFEVYINSNKIDVQRTYFSSPLNTTFDYSTGNGGYTLSALDNLTITVIHNRPSLGDFEGRIQINEVG